MTFNEPTPHPSFVLVNAGQLVVGDQLVNLGEITKITSTGVFLYVRYSRDFWDDEINQLGVIGDIEWTGREREVIYYCQDDGIAVERVLVPVGAKVRLLRADPGERFLADEIGTVLPNDYADKYAYKVLLDAQPTPEQDPDRTYYFYINEVEEVQS